MKAAFFSLLFLAAVFSLDLTSNQLGACLDAGFDASHCRAWNQKLQEELK